MELVRRTVLISFVFAFLLSACGKETPSGPPAAAAPQAEPVAATPTSVSAPVATIQPTPAPEPTSVPSPAPTSAANKAPVCVPGPSEKIPLEIASNSSSWPLPNRDYASTRATFDSNISAETIDRLEVAWEFTLLDISIFGAAASNLLVLDGVVYFQDLQSNIIALDFDTGDVMWKHGGEGPSVGPNGMAVGYCKVFAALSDSTFQALDITTGLTLWMADIELTNTEGIDIQPVVYDGLVYLSTVPINTTRQYGGGGVGIIYALDHETGRIVWSFNTVDSDDVWGNREVNSGGGAWFPTSIDTERGLTYWGIGNPAPWPGTKEFPNGSSRPGPNLYTNSIVALDHRTGELAWFNQVRPHDLFDLDFQVSPILTTAQIGGQARDIAIGAGKTGTVHAFDSDTGEELWVTQVGIHQNDDLEEIPEGEFIEVFPGNLGGVETLMAYAQGVVYVPIMNLSTTYTPSSNNRRSFGFGTGAIVAIDVDSGDILWETEFDDLLLGSATVVNDLVITSVYGGTAYALDRATGEIVWSYELGAGINAPVTVAGDTIIIPVGVPLRNKLNIRLIALRLPD